MRGSGGCSSLLRGANAPSQAPRWSPGIFFAPLGWRLLPVVLPDHRLVANVKQGVTTFMYPYFAQPGESLSTLSRKLEVPLALLVTCNPHIKRPRRKFRRTQVVLVPIFTAPYAPYYTPYPPYGPYVPYSPYALETGDPFATAAEPYTSFSTKRSPCYSKDSSSRV